MGAPAALNHAARRRRRIRLGGLGAALAGVLAFVVATGFVVLPHEDPLPRHADVAVVLGPPRPERVRTALDLLRAGVVDRVLISISADAAEAGTWSAAAMQQCASDPRVRCERADPHTTQGEARLLERKARENGWRSAVVITQTSHVVRAGVVIRRCYSGEVTTRASGEGPSGGWLYQIAYQSAAMAKAILHDQC